MGIFNEHSNNQPQQQNLRGLRGLAGVGFSLTSDDKKQEVEKCW